MTPQSQHVLGLAARQHQVVARTQLLELGVSRRTVDRLVRDGLLRAVHRGVYQVGPGRLDIRGKWLAAVFACGPEAVLSHGDSAALHDLESIRGRDIHVTSTHERGRRRPGIRLHLTRSLPPEDRTVIEGIPTTSVHRTMFDLAETEHKNRFERAAEAAERQHKLDVDELRAVMRRAPGRHALKPLRAWLSENHGTPEETRSELEERLRDFCKVRALDLPAMNVTVAGYEVDCFWPATGLILELDSWQWHKTREAFERDRLRDVALDLAGYRPRRLTSRMLTHRSDDVERLIRG